MIYFFTGENSFEIERALEGLVDDWIGRIVHDNAGLVSQPERIDGTELDLRLLPDLLTAATLFAQHRLVIIKGLSENKPAWEALPGLLPRLADDIELVLIDAKPDKRLAGFKALKAAADYREFPAWTERDTAKAEAWLLKAVPDLDITLDKKSAHLLVERIGVDQWELWHGLEKLSLAVLGSEGAVTPELITELIDANPQENVFNLLETALKGNAKKVHDMLQTLELTEEPYKLFALLSSQVFQLAAIYAAQDQKDAQVASDFGLHPFVVNKLSTHAKKLSRSDIRRIVQAFTAADTDLKTSRGEPWLLIEKALLRATK